MAEMDEEDAQLEAVFAPACYMCRICLCCKIHWFLPYNRAVEYGIQFSPVRHENGTVNKYQNDSQIFHV